MAKNSSRELAHQLHLRITQLESLYRVSEFLNAPHEWRPVFFRDDQHLKVAQGNMGAVLLSMLYSLSDPRGVDFRKLTTEDETLRASLADLAEKWEPIRVPIAKVRSNMAFHGAAKIEQFVVELRGLTGMRSPRRSFLTSRWQNDSSAAFSSSLSFARRQRTWLRREPVEWLEPESARDEISASYVRV